MCSTRTVNNIIIVGNGEDILKNKHGPKIDSFDKVVRLGQYVLDGYEDYTGIKTDIISTIYWKLNLDRLKNTKVILNVPLNLQKQFDDSLGYIEKNLKDYENNILYLNTENDIQGLRDFYLKEMPVFPGLDKANFSLGFKTFYFINKLFPTAKITATGFDFFKTGWYWNSSHNRDDSNRHPYIYERLWYAKMKHKGLINEL